MKEHLSDHLEITWRYFSLEQINRTEDPEWKLWEQPPEYESSSRLAFHAAEAARQQGMTAFERFHMVLLKACHELGRKVFLRETVLDAAREAGLDLTRFEASLADAALLSKLGEDHTYAVEKHGVFGTPTLLFGNGRAAFLRIRTGVPTEDTLAVWENLYQTIAWRPYIEEVKRLLRPPQG